MACSRASSGLAVSQLVHHLGELGPVDAFAGLAVGASPVDRATANLDFAELLLARVYLQRQRRLRFYQLPGRELGKDFMLALRGLLLGCHAIPLSDIERGLGMQLAGIVRRGFDGVPGGD